PPITPEHLPGGLLGTIRGANIVAIVVDASADPLEETEVTLVRVYTRQPGHTADKGKPFTLPLGSTIDDLAREIHRELPEKMKFARIWSNGRFAGQQVHQTEVIHDGDVVEIHE
ncbi:MAG: TGS domain-containing protein, partial [Tepidisphaeraceae bacterium]